MSRDLGADAIDRVGFLLGEGSPLLVLLDAVIHPRIVELVADIGIEEVDALDLVTFGKTQHLAAERGQAAIEGIKVVDEELDLRRVELDAFHLGGELV